MQFSLSTVGHLRHYMELEICIQMVRSYLSTDRWRINIYIFTPDGNFRNIFFLDHYMWPSAKKVTERGKNRFFGIFYQIAYTLSEEIPATSVSIKWSSRLFNFWVCPSPSTAYLYGIQIEEPNCSKLRNICEIMWK